MSSTEEHYTTGSRGSDYAFIAFFVLLPLLVLVAHIMVCVRKVDRKPAPDLESRVVIVEQGDMQVLPEYAEVQHDTPPPYREVEEPVLSLGIVLVDVDDEYEGDVNVSWS